MASDAGIDVVTRYLEEQGVSYEVVEHEATATAADDARAAGLAADDAAKTVVLRDGDNDRLVVIPASQRLDLHKVRELLGASKSLRLATEDEIGTDFGGFEVGAVPPFGPLVNAPEVIDNRVLDHERILCAGGDHRHGVLIDPNDLVQLTQAQVADVCED